MCPWIFYECHSYCDISVGVRTCTCTSMYIGVHGQSMDVPVSNSKVQTLGHVTHVWCVSMDCIHGLSINVCCWLMLGDGCGHSGNIATKY